MPLTWLHLSDFHVKAGDGYDRDVVLNALVASVRGFRERGRRPDVVFATGDIGFSGKAEQYEIATTFFDDLLQAAGLERRDLFVIPGNHDVDRDAGQFLARSLSSREQADEFFAPGVPRPHLTDKQAAFRAWYGDFFAGVREVPESSCANVEFVEAGGLRLAVLAVNSALFCQGDDDHAKLWVGRRALESAVAGLANADARLALIHHPIDWLADVERANIRALLSRNVDLVLRGHLHETDVESVVSPQGGLVHLAAGAAYQTRRWPNRALFVTLEGRTARVFPIRYEDSPSPIWTVDPSVFPQQPGYTGQVALPRRDDVNSAPDPPVAAATFRSNLPSNRALPFVGRSRELHELGGLIESHPVVVVSGPPGVGKSELALEFARVERDRYPGGTFRIDATGAGALVDLARVGVNHLGLQFRNDLSIEDQCEQALIALAMTSSLLIYDNVHSFKAIERWLPAAHMPCRVVITSVGEPRDPGWPVVLVDPLSPEWSVDLVEALAGADVAHAYGSQLALSSGGLPVEICPTAAVLAYERRRGRTGTVAPGVMATETRASFAFVYQHLDVAPRLLLHAAAVLEPQRIDRAELQQQLQAALGWTELDFRDALDACVDLHLVQGDAQLTMHQLFSSFLREMALDDSAVAERLTSVRKAQRDRLIRVAADLIESPADAALAASLLGFALAPEIWQGDEDPPSVSDATDIGLALTEVGQFDQARRWFEQAVEEARLGDIHGRVDHESLGTSLHQVGFCYSGMGDDEQARGWFEQAVAEKRHGDIHGRVDHESLGVSLHEVGSCYSSTGHFEQARSWFEQAVEEARLGDIHGRVDHESLGTSLHQVGFCYSGMGDDEQARGWHEQAVAESRLGDIHGRVDHESLGVSLHEVGSCYSSTGHFEQARSWFEQAVAEKRHGDIHGRVDHESLGGSLHEVGSCYSGMGDDEQARGWHEQAVAEKRHGDIHGRVDHESLGGSLHEVGSCYSSTGYFEQARSWFEQAVAEKRHGDIHGRVDHESLGGSLHEVGSCYSSTGHFEQARSWFEQAVAEERHGDIHGRVDHESLRTTLLAASRCCAELGDNTNAAVWRAEASALGDPPR